MQISNKSYDVLSDLVKVGLPALGAFYAALAILWGLPYGEQIVGTLAALAAVLGVFLKIISAKYVTPTNGVVDIDVANPEHATVRLAMDDDPRQYSDGDTVTLKVSSNLGRYGRHEGDA